MFYSSQYLGKCKFKSLVYYLLSVTATEFVIYGYKKVWFMNWDLSVILH